MDKKWNSQNSFLRIQRNIFSLFLQHQNFRTLFALWVRNFWQSYQNCILWVQGNILLQKMFSGKNNKFMNFFWHWANNFPTFAENFLFRQGCWNCILPVQMNILEKNIFWEILKFQNFLRTLSKKFPDFQRKFLVVMVKNVFYESIGICWDVLKKNVNMFTPNWQIPQKRINLLRERFSFRNLYYDGK